MYVNNKYKLKLEKIIESNFDVLPGLKEPAKFKPGKTPGLKKMLARNINLLLKISLGMKKLSIYISEPGLYQFLAVIRKPKAEAFQDFLVNSE